MARALHLLAHALKLMRLQISHCTTAHAMDVDDERPRTWLWASSHRIQTISSCKKANSSSKRLHRHLLKQGKVVVTVAFLFWRPTRRVDEVARRGPCSPVVRRSRRGGVWLSCSLRCRGDAR